MNALYAILFFGLGAMSVIVLEVLGLDAILDGLRASLGSIFG